MIFFDYAYFYFIQNDFGSSFGSQIKGSKEIKLATNPVRFGMELLK